MDALPRGGRIAALVVREVAVIGFFLLLAWYGAAVLRMLAGDMLVTVDIPVQLTQSVIPIGAALLVIAELLNLPEWIRWTRQSVRGLIMNPAYKGWAKQVGDEQDRIDGMVALQHP